ncbi:MAG: Bug family tripartite tricarboxylate transporter substrate binding protein [Alphaproteobacteria bacterium]
MRLSRPSLALCALLAPLALAETASAQQNFYAGKTVNIVVGFTPGGGYDAYARLLARHFGRHIPGNPNIVVQNMPGAGSLQAVRNLDGAAQKDGTVIAAFNPGLLIQSMTIPDKITVNFQEFAWLGSIGNDLRVCYTWGAKNIKSFDDLLKQSQVIMGDTGTGSSAYVNQKMLQQIFGVKMKQVLGYPGSAEKRIAIERGELDGDCGSWTSIPEDWIRDKKIDVLIRFQKEVSHGLQSSVTYAGDRVKDPNKKKLLDLLNAPSEIGRPYILSKAVPADRVATLRAAFDATMKDAQFNADADKQQLIIDPIQGARVGDMLKELYSTPPDVVKEAKEITGT